MIVARTRALCAANGTNFAQLEKALGFGNGAIARWDDSPPAVSKVKAVADYFGVTVDELIREETGQKMSGWKEAAYATNET